MKRREFIAGLFVALAFAGPVLADSMADRIERQLRQQGYKVITVQRTLLGRTRIIATSSDARREIILNPRTGEILRDFWQPVAGGKNNAGNRLIGSDKPAKTGSDTSSTSDDPDEPEDPEEPDDPEDPEDPEDKSDDSADDSKDDDASDSSDD